MLKSIGLSLWSLVLLVLLPVGLAAQQGGFIYTNNDTTPNTISAYAFDSSGGLNQVPYDPNDPTSTFPTNGNGSIQGYYAANRIIIVQGSTSDFLYASNSGTDTVSAFTIDPSSGYLMPVPGSPFSTGAVDNPNNSSISLAATPDGKYLYAGSTGYDANFNVGPITIFSIDSTTGALTVSRQSPVLVGAAMSSMKVSPDGKYLVAAIPSTPAGQGEIAVFAIHGPGTPHEVHNSPYVLSSSTGPVSSLEFNCAGNLLFAGGTQGYIYVFNFASGNLTPVAGSPFSTGTTSNMVVALSTNDQTLFASDPSSGYVTAFGVDANGVLKSAVSAYAAGTGGFNAVPGGLAVSNGGTFLFSADQYSGVSSSTSTAYKGGFTVFSLSPLPISFQLLTPTVWATGFHSLAAYPGKVCSGAAAATVVHGHH